MVCKRGQVPEKETVERGDSIRRDSAEEFIENPAFTDRIRGARRVDAGAISWYNLIVSKRT